MLNLLKDKLRNFKFLRRIYWKIRNLNPILIFKKFRIKSSFNDENFFDQTIPKASLFVECVK